MNRADQNSAIYNTQVAAILRQVRDDYDEQHRHSRQVPTTPSRPVYEIMRRYRIYYNVRIATEPESVVLPTH